MFRHVLINMFMFTIQKEIPGEEKQFYDGNEPRV